MQQIFSAGFIEYVHVQGCRMGWSVFYYLQFSLDGGTIEEAVMWMVPQNML